LIKPIGRQILIGPVFYPGRSACWKCLAQRLRINRAVEMFVQRKQSRDEPFSVPAATTAATQQIAYGMAASEIAKWIGQDEVPCSDATVLSLDVFSWTTQLHPLVRQPHCSACGDPARAQRTAEPIVLKSCSKAFTEDGGHRATIPKETLLKYERHVSPIT